MVVYNKNKIQMCVCLLLLLLLLFFVERDLFHSWIEKYVYFIRRFATHEIHIFSISLDEIKAIFNKIKLLNLMCHICVSVIQRKFELNI